MFNDRGRKMGWLTNKIQGVETKRKVAELLKAGKTSQEISDITKLSIGHVVKMVKGMTK